MNKSLRARIYFLILTCDLSVCRLVIPSFLYQTRRNNPLVQKGPKSAKRCFVLMTKRTSECSNDSFEHSLVLFVCLTLGCLLSMFCYYLHVDNNGFFMSPDGQTDLLNILHIKPFQFRVVLHLLPIFQQQIKPTALL